MNLRRSPAEIRFRLAQEFWNFRSFLFPPRAPADLNGFQRLFPAADSTLPFLDHCPTWRANTLALARQIAGGEIPLLGTSVLFHPDRNSASDWRRDSINGPSSSLVYFRRIPYLNVALAGDHKVIWELNRHQHLVLLAQAALVEPDEPLWLKTLERHLESWFEANPFHRGMNWASALEVAFRALSWIWILHLVGDLLSGTIRRSLLESLYRHGLHIERNLSIYFAPNTHLLGEAVCLDALGRFLPMLPEAGRWRKLGSDWVERSLETQVLPDGVYFEQSSYYHLYGVDLFLFHAVLSPVSKRYKDRLKAMCQALAAFIGEDGRIPLFGDDDGGRFFHPYGERRTFGAATLTTASFLFNEPAWRFSAEHYAEVGLWLLGQRDRSEFDVPATPDALGNGVFPDAGVFVVSTPDFQLFLLARAFGAGSAGHSHAHGLHVLLRHKGSDLLIDSGTFTYVSDPAVRNRFRSARAHNTICVDSMDQATPVNAFRWGPDRGIGLIEAHESSPGRFAVSGSFRSASSPVIWFRSLSWSQNQPLQCVDLLENLTGEHLVEQFWHCPADAQWDADARCLRWASGACLYPDARLQAEFLTSEVSEALYHRCPARCLRMWGRFSLIGSISFSTTILIDGPGVAGSMS